MRVDAQRETIAAIATAPGRGGVAIVRVSGAEAFRVAAALTGRRVAASRAGRFVHAVFRDAAGRALDDGLLLVFAGPRSYTGEDVVEFQGHGGRIAPRRVLEACLAAGARLARRGEFTERAFLNGRLGLGAAEAVLDLIDAKTARAADDARARLDGAATRALEDLYTAAVDLSARVEHALDFSEDELPPDFAATLRTALGDLRARIDRKAATAREGRLLREGALVVLAGAPNAGKSSLLNALLGARRAIVSDEAGTTRDALEEGLDVDGWPVRLVDTAGLRAATGAVEAEGVARARALIDEADVVLHLVPWATAPDDDAAPDARELRVWSKGDEVRALPPPRGAGVRVSSVTGEGLDDLRAALTARLAALAARGDEETGADVTTRELEGLVTARAALDRTEGALVAGDWVVAANDLAAASSALGRVLGKTYSDDLLTALFSRFCVGK